MGKPNLKQKKLKGRNVYNFYERWVGWGGVGGVGWGGWGGWVGGWDISGVGSHMRKLIESLSGN